MNDIILSTLITRNGTKVVKELVNLDNGKCTRRQVYLPKNSPLKKAGIDGFYQYKGDYSEPLSQITAYSEKIGIITTGHENVKRLIQAIRQHKLKIKTID